jgi:hypothetical protein
LLTTMSEYEPDVAAAGCATGVSAGGAGAGAGAGAGCAAAAAAACWVWAAGAGAAGVSQSGSAACVSDKSGEVAGKRKLTIVLIDAASGPGTRIIGNGVPEINVHRGGDPDGVGVASSQLRGHGAGNAEQGGNYERRTHGGALMC